jgi:conjugal transfer mating pair stabilization protein TraN
MPEAVRGMRRRPVHQDHLRPSGPSGLLEARGPLHLSVRRLDTSECDELRARGCGQISSTCVETSDTGCSYYENLFQCVVTPAETSTVADCGTQTFCMDGNCFAAGHANDADFAKVVAAMEALREAGMYLDEDALTLFNGRAGKCSRKLFGLVNCCKAKSGGAPTNAQAFKAVTEAAGMGYDYARSTYMYDALFNNDAADWVMKGLYGADAGLSANPSFSYYGFTGTFNAASLSSSAITLLDTGNFVVAFDPVSFAVGIAIQFVHGCPAVLRPGRPDGGHAQEQPAVPLPGQLLLQEVSGGLSRKEGELLLLQFPLGPHHQPTGSRQIGKSWGGAKSPNCTGFTPESCRPWTSGRWTSPSSTPRSRPPPWTPRPSRPPSRTGSSAIPPAATTRPSHEARYPVHALFCLALHGRRPKRRRQRASWPPCWRPPGSRAGLGQPGGRSGRAAAGAGDDPAGGGDRASAVPAAGSGLRPVAREPSTRCQVMLPGESAPKDRHAEFALNWCEGGRPPASEENARPANQEGQP